jgi:hypothetical protein
MTSRGDVRVVREKNAAQVAAGAATNMLCNPLTLGLAAVAARFQ